MDFNNFFLKYAIYFPVVYLRTQNVFGYLRQLLKNQYINKEQLSDLQLKKLKNLIAHTSKYVQRYKRLDISENYINELNDIRRLPFTTKKMLKSDSGEFESEQSFFFLTPKTTGGSTGEPITIPKTANSMAWELAATWRGYSWANIDIGYRQARFWGVPFGNKDMYRAKLIDFICNRKRCSAFSFDQSDLESFTLKLKRFKPQYFYGYVSMLCEYAKYFQEFGDGYDYNLKCIISTSEVLSHSHKMLLESVFKTKVYNEYGCGEVGSVAHECEYGSLHIMAENMIVEVIDGERVCESGEEGELVITELNNYALPLIRYRTGDYGSISQELCQCGRSLPIIKKISGRAYDTIENRFGKKFHGEFFMYIIEEAKRKGLGVEACQVKQKDLQHLEFKIVPGVGYGIETEKFIKKRIDDDFDSKTIIDFIQAPAIERELSGKMRVVVGLEK